MFKKAKASIDRFWHGRSKSLSGKIDLSLLKECCRACDGAHNPISSDISKFNSGIKLVLEPNA